MSNIAKELYGYIAGMKDEIKSKCTQSSLPIKSDIYKEVYGRIGELEVYMAMLDDEERTPETDPEEVAKLKAHIRELEDTVENLRTEKKILSKALLNNKIEKIITKMELLGRIVEVGAHETNNAEKVNS